MQADMKCYSFNVHFKVGHHETSVIQLGLRAKGCANQFNEDTNSPGPQDAFAGAAGACP